MFLSLHFTLILHLPKRCFFRHLLKRHLLTLLILNFAVHSSEETSSRNNSHDVTFHLQRIQNSAVRVILSFPILANIAIHLQSLHWLPLRVTEKDFSIDSLLTLAVDRVDAP